MKVFKIVKGIDWILWAVTIIIFLILGNSFLQITNNVMFFILTVMISYIVLFLLIYITLKHPNNAP